MPIVPQNNGTEPPNGSARFVDLQTVRIRLLNALGCPPRIIALETTIASLMVSRETADYGLEALTEFLGYDNRRSVSRLLDESAAWQRAANISLCTVLRGQRNVRRVHKFISNKLNAAAFFVLSKLESNADYHTPVLAQIDRHKETAILTFLRLPLTTAYKPAALPASAVKPRERKRSKAAAAAGGGSVYSWDIFCTVPETLKKYGLRFFPLDGKTPRIWKYQQCATKNSAVLSEWRERYPASNWAILTGTPLDGGGYLVVADLDRHGEGEQFGNGFKTLGVRERELGPLPETFTVATKNQGEHRYFRSKRPLPTWSKKLGPGFDCKGNGSGFVVAPGSPGYEVIEDLPIAVLPEAWDDALNLKPKTERHIPVGQRHNYLRRVSYSMACQGKLVEEIMAVLYARLRFNCVAGGREITEAELLRLARSGVAKINANDRQQGKHCINRDRRVTVK